MIPLSYNCVQEVLTHTYDLPGSCRPEDTTPVKSRGIQSIQTHCAKEIKSREGNQAFNNSAPFNGQHAVEKTQQASNQTKHKQQPGTMKGKEIIFFVMYTLR